jgi:hypothetical protein
MNYIIVFFVFVPIINNNVFIVSEDNFKIIIKKVTGYKIIWFRNIYIIYLYIFI